MIGGSLRPLPPQNWSPWYSWNIAESGNKHNKSNQIKSSYWIVKLDIWGLDWNSCCTLCRIHLSVWFNTLKWKELQTSNQFYYFIWSTVYAKNWYFLAYTIINVLLLYMYLHSPNRTLWLTIRSSSYRFYFVINSSVGTTFVSIVNNMADFITPVSH